jgi:cytochrome bd-type quinol oxidase subunit 1
MKRIMAWRARGAAASQELENHAKALQAKLIKTVHQSDRDKELANMNVNGLQKLINKLNTERDQLSESVKELNTAEGVDSNLKVEYRSHHMQYMVFFVVTIIVVAILFRIQTSQESGPMELIVLIAAVLFMIYHFSGWINTAAVGLWHWLNGLFNF